MVGRLHCRGRPSSSAFAIEPDDGPSGTCGTGGSSGSPRGVRAVLQALRRDRRVPRRDRPHGYRARASPPGRPGRSKRHTGVDELLPGWQRRAATRSAGPSSGSSATSATAPSTSPRACRSADRRRDRRARRPRCSTSTGAAHGPRTRCSPAPTSSPSSPPPLRPRPPGELDRVVDHILGRALVVPLIGVPGAREQAYTTARSSPPSRPSPTPSRRLADGSGRPVRGTDVAPTAIAAKEARVGRPAHRGPAARRRTSLRVRTGGRRDRRRRRIRQDHRPRRRHHRPHGRRLPGPRHLHQRPGRPHPRRPRPHREPRRSRRCSGASTTTSSILDDRTVVIVDEAAMTADADLARLLLGASSAPAPKLVLVGDHRQLSAVGPGGALAALLDRHPEIVTILDHNVRQHDPAERAPSPSSATGRRPGAVDWYLANGPIRIAADPHRDPRWRWSTPGPPTSPPATTPPAGLAAGRRRGTSTASPDVRWDQLGSSPAPT